MLYCVISLIDLLARPRRIRARGHPRPPQKRRLYIALVIDNFVHIFDIVNTNGFLVLAILVCGL